MRPQDHSIRIRAHLLAALTAVGMALLVYAYVIGRSPLPWWLLVVGAFISAAHFYRRSRK